ncbi:MAG: hypothetical protein EBX41_04560 [Chitinophagia bacterium]|nr:hypothetical protein [Chitinophagia bacterium]
MAVIQKIRDRYGKIAGGIIAVSLVSFIISDALNGGLTNLFGGHSTDVMNVDGVKVSQKDYETRVNEYTTLTKIYRLRDEQEVDEPTRNQIREQVIQTMQFEILAGKVCDKLGITTTDKEKKDLIYGQGAHTLIRQFTYNGQPVFSDPNTKQFAFQNVEAIEKQLKKDPSQDPDGKFLETFYQVKNYIERETRYEKFNAIFANSVYMPNFVAMREVKNKGMMASLRYVKVPFNVIPDAEVKVTDEDIKQYIQKHKGIFETDEETRTLEYVVFDLSPSKEDTARTVASVEELRTDFANAKDNTVFCNSKTDDPATYSEAFVTKKTFTSYVADTLMKLPVNTIYGPYFEANSYRLTKIVDKQTLPDSVKCRHILIKVSDPGGKEVIADSVAKKRADSIMTAIAGGASFDSVTVHMSDDGGSKDKGGEYWFNLLQRPGLSKAFGDFVFEGKVGDKKVIKADNSKTGGYVGYHYIEVLEQKDIAPCMKLATVIKTLRPSETTTNTIYGNATAFIAKSATAKDFDANVAKDKLSVRQAPNIKQSSYTIEGLGGARELIRWAYKHQVGDVSKDVAPFLINGEKYVVLKLAGVMPKGLMPINSLNRAQLEQRLREEKKGDLIAKKYNGQSLEAIAQASGQPLSTADLCRLYTG